MDNLKRIIILISRNMGIIKSVISTLPGRIWRNFAKIHEK